MPGTLLVYDAAFPRARAPNGPILNTPSDAELLANRYPVPHELLAIDVASSPEQYCRAISTAARAMPRPNRLIIFGHGQVVNAVTRAGIARVTTGIILGASPLTASNAALLNSHPIEFARNARVELWVCEAAAAGEAGGQSGVLLCQAIADALGVTVVASTIAQEYSSRDQTELPGGGWLSTAQFLPWEGRLVRFTPRVRRRRTRR